MNVSFHIAAKFLVLATSVAALIGAAPRTNAQVDAGATLSKYEAALQSLRCAEYKAHVATYYKKGSESEKLQKDMRYAWRCNGGLAKVLIEGKIWSMQPGKDEVYERKSVLLIDPRGDQSNVDWRAGGRVAFLMDRKPNGAQQRLPFGVAPFTHLHGYLTSSGVPYVPDVLRESRLTARTESLDQRNVVLLEGTGRSGRLRLWCDPTTGFWPRKLEWQLAATDVLLDMNGKKPEEKTLARSGLDSIVISVSGWDFARISDRWVPTTFTEERTTRYPDSPAVATRSVCTVSDVSIAPGHLDDPAAFELGSEIPNGTRVTVSNEPQIEYVWRDGSVVKKIDADLGALEGHNVSRTGLPKSLITIAAIAAVMIVVLLVVWRRRTATR